MSQLNRRAGLRVRWVFRRLVLVTAVACAARATANEDSPLTLTFRIRAEKCGPALKSLCEFIERNHNDVATIGKREPGGVSVFVECASVCSFLNSIGQEFSVEPCNGVGTGQRREGGVDGSNQPQGALVTSSDQLKSAGPDGEREQASATAGLDEAGARFKQSDVSKSAVCSTVGRRALNEMRSVLVARERATRQASPLPIIKRMWILSGEWSSGCCASRFDESADDSEKQVALRLWGERMEATECLLGSASAWGLDTRGLALLISEGRCAKNRATWISQHRIGVSKGLESLADRAMAAWSPPEEQRRQIDVLLELCDKVERSHEEDLTRACRARGVQDSVGERRPSDQPSGPQKTKQSPVEVYFVCE